MTDRPLVAIVHLGRQSALGERARVRSWRRLCGEAGFDTADIGVRRDHAVPPSLPVRPWLSVSSITVPEATTWSARSVRRELVQLQPHAVVALTLRAYHPLLKGPWPLVLDYVDRLSDSYRDRGQQAGPARRLAFTMLGLAHARAESHHRDDVRTVAAGRTDAEALGATWIPNIPDLNLQPATQSPTHDVVFFGNLAYPPNRLALAFLAQLWPTVIAARPNTTLLVGGANTDDNMVRLCADQGWHLHGRFEDPIAFAARGRVAVAPMTHTAGIQNKILEAAAADRPQVLTPAAAAGLDRPPPGIVTDRPGSFAQAILDVLDHPHAYAGARDWVKAEFSAGAWTSVVRNILCG